MKLFYLNMRLHKLEALNCILENLNFLLESKTPFPNCDRVSLLSKMSLKQGFQFLWIPYWSKFTPKSHINTHNTLKFHIQNKKPQEFPLFFPSLPLILAFIL